MRIMPRKPFRKSSLLTRCRECFFGFADSAKEEYFTRLQVECRTFPIVLLSLAYCASSITKIMAPEHSHEHVMERILLEPLTPVPAVCLASAALLGRWRWVEPLTIICSIMRHLTLMLWLMCDPASAPPVVGRWDGMVSDLGSWLCFTCWLAVSCMVFHARFRFHFLVSLMWMLSVPSMVNRSPADISPWPVIVIRVISTLLRLHTELKARSQFVNRYYSATESSGAGMDDPVEEPRGSPSVGRLMGQEILDPVQKGNCTVPAKEPTHELRDREILDPIQEGSSNVEEPTDELSDQEIRDLIEYYKIGSRDASALLPMHQTVYLRIPGADPDDLPPDAEDKLRREFEAANPGYVVQEITFMRGSLLVGLRLSSCGAGEDICESPVEKLKEIKHSSWLTWLGLPTDMDMSVKFGIHAERQTSLLNDCPLAVTVPKSEEGVCIVSLPLRCSELPMGIAIKASLGAQSLVCDVVQAKVEDVPSRCPANEQGRLTLQVKLPVDTLMRVSACWVLTVHVQDLEDHVIVGDRSVVLLDEALAVMVPELCSMRLLRPQDMPLDLKCPDVDQPWGAEIVYALGLWLQTLDAKYQLAHGGRVEASEIVEQVISKELADMWRAGNHLLMLLVGKGCKDSAKLVIDLLLNSPALRPCVHRRAHTEGLDDSPSFHDFISGAHNTRGSTIMHLAVHAGSYAMVDEVMHWSDVYKTPCQWAARDEFGMTPLHLAVLVNDGNMARFLLRKGDAVLQHAWQSCDGGRSPEHFFKRTAKMSAAFGGGMKQQERSRTSIQSLPRPRQPRMTGQTTSVSAQLLPPAIMPTPASAGPYNNKEAHHQSQDGHLLAQTPHSASPVVPNQPKLAGGPNPSSFIQDLWHSFSSLPLSNLKTRFTAILGFLLVPTTLLCLFLKVSPCILSWLFAMYFVCYLLPWLLNIHLVLRRQLRVGSFLLADKKPM